MTMYLRTPAQYRGAVDELHKLEARRDRAGVSRRHDLLAAVHEFDIRCQARPALRKGKPAPFALSGTRARGNSRRP